MQVLLVALVWARVYCQIIHLFDFSDSGIQVFPLCNQNSENAIKQLRNETWRQADQRQLCRKEASS